MDDPDVTLLDVGHPLVRRLIEQVKQNAFRGDQSREGLPHEDREHYGRTAYLVTPDVDEVTALFHLLARYAVNTQPISIVEELLPVVVPVYVEQPVDIMGEAAERLLDARLSTETRTEGEV